MRARLASACLVCAGLARPRVIDRHHLAAAAITCHAPIDASAGIGATLHIPGERSTRQYLGSRGVEALLICRLCKLPELARKVCPAEFVWPARACVVLADRFMTLQLQYADTASQKLYLAR